MRPPALIASQTRARARGAPHTYEQAASVMYRHGRCGAQLRHRRLKTTGDAQTISILRSLLLILLVWLTVWPADQRADQTHQLTEGTADGTGCFSINTG